MPAGPSTHQRRRWRLAAAVVLLAALAVGLSGIDALPIDAHEALVLGSVREMSARGDWVVPWFNGEPRLNKPPMSYWATAAAAAAAGRLGQPLPRDGRLPSVLGGVLVVAVTMWIGRRWLGPAPALVAGAMAAASVGLFTYSHDARPDMLYAAWCAVVIALLSVLLAPQAAPQPWGRRALWLACAGATLTKGPQVPAMLLVGGALAARTAGLPWRDIATRLRPGRGLVVWLAVAAPWWLAIAARLGTDRFADSQAAGTLLRPGLGHLLDGYYLYRPLLLLAPWALLAPLAIRAAARERSWAVRLAVALWITAVVAFSLGSQQRWFYLLPLLPAGAVLLAAGALQPGSGTARGACAFGWAVLAAAAGLLGWLLADGWLPGGALAAVAAALLVAAAGLAWRLRRSRTGVLAASALGLAAVLVAVGPTAAPWGAQRYEQRALGARLRELAGDGTPVLALGVTPAVYVYYLGRPIAVVNGAAEVLARAARASGPVLVLASGGGRDALAALPRVRERARIRHGEHGPTVLFEIR